MQSSSSIQQGTQHSIDGAYINRLIIHDQISSQRFLVDTGADISVIPPTTQEKFSNNNQHNLVKLFAANGSEIKSYGEKTISLNLGMKHSFSWQFVIADVRQPILGSDFLGKFFGLLIDVQRGKLIDRNTSIESSCEIQQLSSPVIKAYNMCDPFQCILQEFEEIINPNQQIGSARTNVVHHIETTGQPRYARPRRLPPDRLAMAQEEFRVMCQQGLCQPSKSAWASPLHIVRKSNGEWRYCGDYRALNATTVPDRFPIPYLQDFTYNLHGKKVFSVIDLKKAYYQIPVNKEDIAKTAITTPFGMFEFCYMTFGLRNAAQTFQRFIMEVLSGLTFAFVYIDDICISSTTSDEHKQHLRLVFKRLQQHGLTINLAKCQFGRETIKFLGHLVDGNGIHPLPEKVEAIQNYVLPKTAQELKRFLALINFYRRFIPKAVHNQMKLQALIVGNKKNDTTEICWDSERKIAFERCKTDLATSTILSHPAIDANISLSVDASATAVGAVLHQYINNTLQPLTFFSKKLQKAETRYSTYDREL